MRRLPPENLGIAAAAQAAVSRPIREALPRRCSWARTVACARSKRPGFTLLEVTLASTLLATMAAASVVLVRTTHQAWLRHRDDQTTRQAATAALQHLARKVRQASQVVSVTGSGDNSGELKVLLADGSQAVWSHDSPSSQILYGIDTASDLLAPGIASATFVGMRANGWQEATDPALVHAVQCTLTFSLDRPGGPTVETISSKAWLRSW